MHVFANPVIYIATSTGASTVLLRTRYNPVNIYILLHIYTPVKDTITCIMEVG